MLELKMFNNSKLKIYLNLNPIFTIDHTHLDILSHSK